MTFDFSQIKITDINGNAVETEWIEKELAQTIFLNFATSIPVHEFAINLNKRKPFTIEDADIEEVKKAIEAAINVIYIKQPILNYLK